jgi:hypothetical protein
VTAPPGQHRYAPKAAFINYSSGDKSRSLFAYSRSFFPILGLFGIFWLSYVCVCVGGWVGGWVGGLVWACKYAYVLTYACTCMYADTHPYTYDHFVQYTFLCTICIYIQIYT